jgi:hypothetical protein
MKAPASAPSSKTGSTNACAHAAPFVTAVIVDDGSNPQEEGAPARRPSTPPRQRLQAAGAPHRMVYLRANGIRGRARRSDGAGATAADATSTWWVVCRRGRRGASGGVLARGVHAVHHTCGHRVRITRAHGWPIRESIAVPSPAGPHVRDMCREALSFGVLRHPVRHESSSVPRQCARCCRSCRKIGGFWTSSC